jgi:hypothetical protein
VQVQHVVAWIGSRRKFRAADEISCFRFVCSLQSSSPSFPTAFTSSLFFNMSDHEVVEKQQYAVADTMIDTVPDGIDKYGTAHDKTDMRRLGKLQQLQVSSSILIFPGLLHY